MDNFIAKPALYICCIFAIICFLCSYSYTNNVNQNPVWYDQLPNCPCQNPDIISINTIDGWAKDKGDIAKYHTGAVECFRSYPPIKTNEGQSGQQCCYDKNNNLITEGSGAGTPDKISTCSGEDKKGFMTTRFLGFVGHYQKDVKPWNEMGGQSKGWIKYNLLWKPNKGDNCKDNKVIK